MDLVVDTNELFSFFESDPKVRQLILHPDIRLFSPDFSMEEVNNLSKKIKDVSGIKDEEYEFFLGVISGLVEVIPEVEYKGFIGKAKTMMSDVDDVSFLALALKMRVPIWSDDKHFKEQSEIKVYTTDELEKLLTEE